MKPKLSQCALLCNEMCTLLIMQTLKMFSQFTIIIILVIKNELKMVDLRSYM